jgi:hypothetical protein
MKRALNPLWAGKSRQRKAILGAAKQAGLTVLGLTWDPIGAGNEMCGPNGGWQLDTKEHGIIPAYNVKEMIREIASYVSSCDLCRKPVLLPSELCSDCKGIF